MTPQYPEDSLQSVVGTWWDETGKGTLCRGRLVRAFLPHVDQIPSALRITGRVDSTSHSEATYSVEALRIKNPPPAPRLPVAALPHYPGEARIVTRAKKRPALVLSLGGVDIPQELRGGSSANWMTAPTVLVAPYYGVEANEKRAGWKPALVERIRHSEFPQYLWDRLPIDGADFSILRFDHLQPVGRHHDTIEATPFCLGQDGLDILDEWLRWLVAGRMDPDGVFQGLREELLKLPRLGA